MALVSYSLPNLVGGVSQQPETIRVPNAHEETINTWPSLVAGLQKRPGLNVVTQIDASTIGVLAGHTYTDPISGQTFFIIVRDGTIRVFNQDGEEKTVNGSLATSYLSLSDPKNSVKMLTFGDTTFILNKSVTVEADAVSESGSGRVDPTDRWTIFVAEAVANAYYTLYVNGVKKAEFLTGDNTDSSSALESTSEIATELYNDLSSEGYTVTRYSSVIALEVPSGHEVTVYEEGRAGKSMQVFSTAVEDFSDLPPHEEEGRLVRVSGDVEEAGDDYYVVFNDEGLWVETYGYGEGLELDADTMPHTLVYDQSTDEFTFGPHTWESRLAGDDDSAPAPTFVDRTINDIFIHQGRLGFLSDENVILSEANTYNNFWRTTVVQLLDSDPIDLAAVSGRVSILNHAIPFNRNLLLFSDRAQYVVDTGEILSPQTAVVSYSTAYPASIRRPPVNIGPYVYFLDDTGSHPRLLEYYTDNNVLTDNADDVSIQIPEYIDSPARFMTGSTHLNVILIQGDDRSTLYTYRFVFGADTKIQSAWGKWTFPGTIRYYEFVDNALYVFSNYDDGFFMEKLTLEEDAIRAVDDFPICLDHKITLADCTVSYDSGTDKTTITTPYEYPETVTMVTAPAEENSGIEFHMTNTTGNEYTVDGDVSGYTDAMIGIPYQFYWKLSQQVVRETKGNGTVVVQDGRLSLRYMSLSYKDTSAFTVKVTLQGGREYEYDFEGRTLGSPLNILGNVSIDSGTFRVPIMGENTTTDIEVINDTPYHCTFTACEWNAQWRPKSTRRL